MLERILETAIQRVEAILPVRERDYKPMIDWKEMRTEILESQLNFIAAIRTRHFEWAAETGDPELAKIHFEIVALFEDALWRYDRLLDTYQKPPDVGTAR
jgi:hypothetical protein